MTTARVCGRRAALLAFVVVPCTLTGQRSTTSRPAAGTEILTLGTAGGPLLRVDRSEPATILIVDGRPYLIDCGIGTAHRLVQAGVGSQTIRAIFFTHLHADHTLGLADVLANDIQERGRADAVHSISIYGPPQIKALVDAAYHYIRTSYAVFDAEGFATGGSPAPLLDVHEIDEGVVYQDDKIRVVAAENSHYVQMPQSVRAIMKSYAYRFETPHGTVVFTGDTGPSDAVVRLAGGADVLVSEVEDKSGISESVDRRAQEQHWSPERRDLSMRHMIDEHLGFEDVGRMAESAHVRSVLLYHWNPEDPAVYVAGVSKYFSGPVLGSADLQRFCVGARAPTSESNEPALRLCE